MNVQELDPAVIAHLPEKSERLSIVQHGKTNKYNCNNEVKLLCSHLLSLSDFDVKLANDGKIKWSTGYKIDINIDGDEKAYFLKVLDRERGDEMVLGEYTSTMTLFQDIPEAIHKAMAWGTFELDKTKAFYLTGFRHLLEELPPIPELLKIIKKLHQTSKSPTGMFGFPVTTFNGPAPMDNAWTDNWEEFFTRDFRASVDYAQVTLKNDPEFTELAESFIQLVIPRLLRPLQSGGRNIKPVLCHGDLWDANAQMDAKTNLPVLFDPCAFYGHNEMDLQAWRFPRHALGPKALSTYKDEVGASKPEQDFDDRNALYSIRNDLLTIGMWGMKWVALKSIVVKEMQRLLLKYPRGIQGFEAAEATNGASQA